MSLKIKHKRSGALNSPPTAAQIEQGEIGINYNKDSLTLYVKDSAGAIRPIAGDGSQGPGKSTAQATAPASPADGDLWIDTSKNPPELNLWDNTASKWDAAGQWVRTGSELSLRTNGDDVIIKNAAGTTDQIALMANGTGRFVGSVSIGGTAPANTIDEYEEGTWTPTITDFTNAAQTMFTVSVAVYTKVGNLISCYVVMELDPSGAIATTSFRLPLPFTGQRGSGSFIQVTDAPDVISGYSKNNYFMRCNVPTTLPIATQTYVGLFTCLID